MIPNIDRYSVGAVPKIFGGLEKGLRVSGSWV